MRAGMRRTIVLGSLLVVSSLSIAAANLQQAGTDPRLQEGIYKVRDNLYVITGSDPEDPTTFTGGQTGVFVTDRGVVLIDTKNPGYGQAILDRIRTVTDKPVTTIIATHSHRDHIGSVPEFSPTVEVIAHENTKVNMQHPRIKVFEGENAKYLPKRTFKDRMSLLEGKDRIDLYYFGRGHTNGDTWVVFPSLRVMHAGDMYSGKRIGLFPPEDGASPLSIPDTYGKVLAELNDKIDIVIASHNNLLRNWNDLREYREFYIDLIAAVRAGRNAGKTVDQIASEFKLPDKYRGYYLPLDRLTYGVQVIYDELAKTGGK